MSALEIILDRAMMRAMNDPEFRLLLWHIVDKFLCTFVQGYAHNATAYSLLAKKEEGLRLYSWMKRISPQGTFVAESDYNNIINKTNQTQEGEDNGRGSEADRGEST